MANGPDGGEACETLDSHPSPFTPLDANYITETAQIGEGSSIIAPRERSTVSKRPAKERHDRASLAEWHSARHELLSARLACGTEEDSDSERTPTKKANRGKAKITPNRGGIQEEDLEREKSLKALLKGRPAKITSDFEAEKVAHEHSLEEDADSDVQSSDQNISPDRRHPSSTHDHSPYPRQWPDVQEYRQNIIDHGLLSVLRPRPSPQPRSPHPTEADSSSSEPSDGELIGHWDGSEQMIELGSLIRWHPSRGNRPLGLDPEEDIWDTWWDDDVGEASDSEAGEATEDEDEETEFGWKLPLFK